MVYLFEEFLPGENCNYHGFDDSVLKLLEQSVIFWSLAIRGETENENEVSLQLIIFCNGSTNGNTRRKV